MPCLELPIGLFQVHGRNGVQDLFQLTDRRHVLVVVVDVPCIIVDLDVRVVHARHRLPRHVPVRDQVRVGLHRHGDSSRGRCITDLAEPSVHHLAIDVARLHAGENNLHAHLLNHVE